MMPSSGSSPITCKQEMDHYSSEWLTGQLVNKMTSTTIVQYSQLHQCTEIINITLFAIRWYATVKECLYNVKTPVAIVYHYMTLLKVTVSSANPVPDTTKCHISFMLQMTDKKYYKLITLDIQILYANKSILVIWQTQSSPQDLTSAKVASEVTTANGDIQMYYYYYYYYYY